MISLCGLYGDTGLSYAEHKHRHTESVALAWIGSGRVFMPGVWNFCYRKPWQGQEAYTLMKERGRGEPLSQCRHSIASLYSIASGRSQWNLCPGNVTSASQRLSQQLKETINK